MDRYSELKRWQVELDEQIGTKEQRLEPQLQELRTLKEQRGHLEGLLRSFDDGLAGESGDTTKPHPVEIGGVTGPLPPNWNWRYLCDLRGLPPGGDSAHRVVMRRDKKLHDSVPHYCVYDKKAYG